MCLTCRAQEGDKVKSFDRICEVQSDKATVEITSRYDGTVYKVHHAEGAIVKVGDSLLDIDTGVAAAAPAAPVSAAAAPTPTPAAPTATATAVVHTGAAAGNTPEGERLRAQATPAVRKMAKEYAIDLSQVTPSGPKGRIVKEDVLLFVQQTQRPRVPLTPTPSTSTSTSAPPQEGDKVVPIRGVARLMVKSMTAAKAVQHLTLCEEVCFDSMRLLRSDLKAASRGSTSKEVKMSYMPLLIKATSLALRQFPMLNAAVNADVSEMTYFADHNIGIAMDTPKGLVVPVLRQVQRKSVWDIARELGALQEAAAAGALTEAQLSGGTFSLSNIGSVGGTYAVPVVVVPQVAIGALGRLQVVPRYTDKQGRPAAIEAIHDGDAEVRPVTIMNVSWSADHRVVDGATVARFSNLWKQYVEHPQRMLADMH